MKKTLVGILAVISAGSIQGQKLTRDYIDRYSTPVCYTIGIKDTTPLWNATGFFIKVKSNIYFFTNNHVVGGKYYINEYLNVHKKMPPKDSFPNSLFIRYVGNELGEFRSFSIPLKNTEGKQLWIDFYEDETKPESQLDVIAIPVPKELYNKIEEINLIEASLNPELALYPSSELYVIGFPLDYGINNIYPIWKRGTIASEPKLNTVGNSLFLIDATTRAGMSGSPVIYRANSYTTYRNSYYAGNLFTFLVGIYSAQNYSSEIGVVIRLEKPLYKLNSL